MCEFACNSCTRKGGHDWSDLTLWLKAYLAIPEFTERQVAACLWNSESAACDRTLSWSMSDDIRQRAYAADLSYRGLPLERHGKLNVWIARERPALIAARVAVWNSVRREFGKSADSNSQPTLPLLGPPSKNPPSTEASTKVDHA